MGKEQGSYFERAKQFMRRQKNTVAVAGALVNVSAGIAPDTYPIQQTDVQAAHVRVIADERESLFKAPDEINYTEPTLVIFPQNHKIEQAPTEYNSEKDNYVESKQRLEQKVRNARERLLDEEQTGKGKLAYVTSFDRAAYGALYAAQDSHPRAFAEVKTALDMETRFNLETLLGEVCNAATSRFSYRIEEGQIFSEHSSEPFLNILKRGQEYREKNGSTVVDREKAEVEGFTKIQQVLCDPDTPAGTIMLSVSPPGGPYRHNFYDGFQKVLGKDGKMKIEALRCSAQLSNAEYAQKLAQYDALYDPTKPITPEISLANPVKISNMKSLDSLQQSFQKESGAMSEKVFKEIVLPAQKGFIDAYIQRLHDPLLPTEKKEEAFKAMLVHVQQFLQVLKQQEQDGVVFQHIIPTTATDSVIQKYAMQQLQGMSLPCGDLAGSGVMGAYGAPIGLAGFGMGLGMQALEFSPERDDYGDLFFKCQQGHTNKRPYNTLIPNCLTCGIDVRCN